ncbi:MAG TPA: prephenate dehydrogenase/arogenate dehydrogenase family protein [Pseudomonadales bacterium]|nr:prephenate dehydrogenase/arogenate dehydrogenase family protein [Pseudomonadales bacterium]
MSLPGRLIIVGTGLIGGSIAAAARERAWAGYVVGVDTDRRALEQGVALGLLDEMGMPADVGADDLVVVTVPTLAVPGVLEGLQGDDGRFAGGATVTDTASVKGSVVSAARGLAGGMPARFVPGHPIAGSERSGVAAARADLFRDHRVILTPDAGTDPDALARVCGLWNALGAEVTQMDVAEHDRVLAMTSHLPHLLAFALVDTLGRQPEHAEIFRLAAGGFRDFTRIASSDPVMWGDIFTANADAVTEILDRLDAELAEIRTLLANGDRDALLALFGRAKRLRDEHVLGMTPTGAGHG